MQTITIAGNIGKVKVQNSNGREFISFTVACNERDNQGNEKTIWYGCTYNFVKVAEYLKAGTRVVCSGRFNPSIYHGQNGASLDLKVAVNQLDFYNVKKDEAPAGHQQPGATAPDLQDVPPALPPDDNTPF